MTTFIIGSFISWKKENLQASKQASQNFCDIHTGLDLSLCEYHKKFRDIYT